MQSGALEHLSGFTLYPLGFSLESLYFQLFEMAEGVGFEPTEPFGSPVFKTGAIDHSTTPPVRCVASGV